MSLTCGNCLHLARLLGSILASAATGGIASTLNNSNESWGIPIRLQLVFPGLVIFLIWTLPESPRWQYTHAQPNEAKEMLVYYHGEGKEESVWVHLQLAEYEKYLHVDGSDRRWWDYKSLFQRKVTRRSLVCACTVAIFGQCSGNGESVDIQRLRNKLILKPL
jgi:MFS family permease